MTRRPDAYCWSWTLTNAFHVCGIDEMPGNAMSTGWVSTMLIVMTRRPSPVCATRYFEPDSATTGIWSCTFDCMAICVCMAPTSRFFVVLVANMAKAVTTRTLATATLRWRVLVSLVRTVENALANRPQHAADREQLATGGRILGLEQRSLLAQAPRDECGGAEEQRGAREPARLLERDHAEREREANADGRDARQAREPARHDHGGEAPVTAVATNVLVCSARLASKSVIDGQPPTWMA